MGGKFHPKLNMNTRLIANKYREGKAKRTLKRELKVLEIVKGEANIAAENVLLRSLISSGTENLNRAGSTDSACTANQDIPFQATAFVGSAWYPHTESPERDVRLKLFESSSNS